jgi:propanol-preferring alcohol dehydrogenase
MLDVVAEYGISVKTNTFKGLEEIEQLVHVAKSGKMKGKGVIIMDPEQIVKERESGLNMV